MEPLTSSPSHLIKDALQVAPGPLTGFYSALTPLWRRRKLRRLGTALPRAGRKCWTGLAWAGGDMPSSCLERS